MAPAACDTLFTLFEDTNTKPSDYDFIVTGDLGKLGSDILRNLMREKGISCFFMRDGMMPAVRPAASAIPHLIVTEVQA